ncbi:hypothetical protein VD0002_g1148 [Verticillium dahliae]|uniref:Aquaporin-1 n=2 Tax=Verticillium dahliae TaxID=27337 RepID=G2XC13_VERDV|nr:aquaporin-1 [Verticillium dahliae VdLs.17]KAF3349527.1 hypothetical protein VdG2_02373 [Verticillium dahliae VDG2]KAH6699280.1 aquaporin-1 [Verticillium dahliae]EGY16427.1 aquaporin-1 [Verticillium dahliae VdLs.17]PNH32670.1 hypothetical protein BJF96_g4032 [Verticillium dahliae]PNH57825.1 hypothetical protein VD0003_g71 [Verticillium dahliae]
MADQNPVPVPGTAQHYPPPDAPAVLESNVYSDAEPSRNPHLRRGMMRSNGSVSSRRGPNTPGAAFRRASSEEPINQSQRGAGGVRYETDEEYSDQYWDQYGSPRHPDFQDPPHRPGTRQGPSHSRSQSRARPPRAHLNRPFNYEAQNEKGEATYVDEGHEGSFLEARPRSSRRRNDEEMGGFAPRYIATNDSARRIDWNSLTRDERAEVMRLPWTQWMNSEVKNHFVASMGEFVGTTMFLFFAFAGTEVANIQSNVTDSGGSDSNTTTGETTGFDVGVLMYISVAFGFSLMVNVWIFFRISGGLFNPAVTLAMLLVRAITPVRAACLFVAQMLGGLISSVMVRYLFPENFNVRTTLGGGASLVQGVFIEAILTAELVFTIFMLAKEKHRATFIAPVGIGLALFIAELVGVQFTGGSLNPARSFGPCVVTATFDKEHWIYWVGPLIGSLIAVVFYKFIKMLEYEMVSPGADGDPTNDPTKNPEKRAEVAFSRSLTNAAKV